MDWNGYIFVFLLYILACFQGVPGIKLLEVRVPLHTVREQSARLECHYDLEGEALYSVKWYKDGNEFYRYVPRDNPPAQIFTLPGVTVDLHNSSESTVVLSSVNLATSGRYRCEVSAEAPSFQTVSEHGDMVVVALPSEGPRISGGRPRYKIDDMVRINCTSGRSKPAAQLTWFINSEPADAKFLRGPFSESGRDGLESSTLGLEFKVKLKHFRKGDMKLKCLATIATVYWRSNEESVEGDQARESVAESRGTAPPSKSRAERVEASNVGSASSCCHVIILLMTALVISR